jgi:hypothetical protein
MGLTNFFPLSCLLSKAKGLPSYNKIAPIPWPKASKYTIIVFLKSIVAKKGVVHISSLSVSKYLVSSYVQENASLFNNVVRGVED